MLIVRPRMLAWLAAAASALALAACGSSSSNRPSSVKITPSAQTAAKAASGTGPRIFVVGGEANDPFWSRVKRGADDAAKLVEAEGGSVTWLGPQNYNNLGPDAAKLLQTAVAQRASGVVGPDWVPQAEDAAFKKITAAHIPLIIDNAGGLQAANNVGAVNYVGTDELYAGKAGGAYFGRHGVKHVLCVNTLPGTANAEARCHGIGLGIASTGGKSTELPLPSSQFGNPTAVAQGVKAALLRDSSIDGVVTISTGDADSAASAIQQGNLQSKVKLGTFDLDPSQLQRIKSSQQLFAIDQQPYMQGFLAVSMLNEHIKWGLDLPQRPILTGPAIIDSANVNPVLAGANAGVR